jgi:beta-ureidopropionase / N-carbamoyl-L-amino-acid hydrolase
MEQAMSALRTDQQRLWQSLMHMAQIGATANGGCCRLALTDEDRRARDLFVEWCRSEGCAVTIDRMGNIFARRPGRDPNRYPVATGSHLDTQPHGGKFDGVFGVLAGMEVLRTLSAHGIETQAPLEVVVWTNEEGARFAPAMIASAVFAGALEIDYALARKDVEGMSFGDELRRIGYAGEAHCGDRGFEAFFEAHIEQGPMLERAHKTIGVVTGVQGSRWYDVTLQGQDAHSGATPMQGRRDALVAGAAIVSLARELADAFLPHAVATVGRMQVTPNSRNTIPGRVELTVDLRHPDAGVLDAMDTRLRKEIERIAAGAGVTVALERVQDTPPVAFDEGCINAVRAAAAALGYGHMDMWSGAGHDSCFVSRVAPTSMVFVPCAAGLSHNEAESAKPEGLAAGADVLLHAMLGRAGQAA